MVPFDQRLSRVESRVNPRPFSLPESLAAWEKRAERLRERIRVAMGIVPRSERPPAAPELFDWVKGDGFSVCKVLFQTAPGFWATGNLFVPEGSGPFPAVLNLFGHWRGGRLEHSDRAFTLARCVGLARMGIVAFVLDTVGYNDSIQVGHRFGGYAERLWGMGPARLQGANLPASVDVLESLPYVDKARIGCVGESGAGSHAALITAVDERIRAVAIVNSVAAHTQPECPCETPPMLRIGANNLEFAALAAPRPMLLASSTGDWTLNTPEVEYPAMQRLYRLYGLEERVELFHQDAPHNFNAAARQRMYRFFAKRLLSEEDVGRDWATLETDLPCDLEALLIFPARSRPSDFPDQAGVIQRFKELDRRRSAMPSDAEGLERAKAETCAPLRQLIAGDWDPEQAAAKPLGDSVGEGFALRRFSLGSRDGGEAIPVSLVWPSSRDHEVATTPESSLLGGVPAPAKSPVAVFHPDGQQALWEGERPGRLLQGFLDQGRMVVTVDLFLTGAYQSSPIGATGRNTAVPSFECYNLTDAANRVRDVVLACEALAHGFQRKPFVVGLGEAALWTALGAALTNQVLGAALRMPDWEENETSYLERLYIPHLLRFGGLRTAWIGLAPRPLVLFRSGLNAFDETVAAYRAAGATDALRVSEGWDAEAMVSSCAAF